MYLVNIMSEDKNQINYWSLSLNMNSVALFLLALDQNEIRTLIFESSLF